jgi:hypothetical protein
MITDVYGRQAVVTHHPNFWRADGKWGAAQTDTSVKGAPGAGLSLYITDIVMSTDTAGSMTMQDEDNAIVVPLMYFAANGGAAMHFRTPLKVLSNKALEIDTVIAGNHSVLVSGYTAP